MGPKKQKSPKQQEKSKKPKPNPKEVVTELMKQVFEIQLADIQKKLERLAAREEELKSGKIDLEKKTEGFRKEHGLIIEEKEKLLALKEEEKIEKRDDMLWHENEIKNRIKNHEKYIVELQKKYSELIAALSDRVKDLEEQVRVLDEFKQNKEAAKNVLIELENELEETEVQHQRNLFEINTKSEMAKVRVKKELETRLLQLSIEFQEMSQKRIGKSCHRLSQENKAIVNELRLMEVDLKQFEERHAEQMQKIRQYRNEQKEKESEKRKKIARLIVQKVIIKSIIKDRLDLTDRLKEYYVVDNTNKTLLKRLKSCIYDIEKKVLKVEEIKKTIEEREDERNQMNEASLQLRRSLRKLMLLTKNSLKLAEEAAAVRLIPLGGPEEEINMSMEAKQRLFNQRRDKVFKRKGRILEHLFETLLKAQMSDEDKKLVCTGSEEFSMSQLNFSNLTKRLGAVDEESAEIVALAEEEKSYVSRSDVSLPRSISEENLKDFIEEDEDIPEEDFVIGELSEEDYENSEEKLHSKSDHKSAIKVSSKGVTKEVSREGKHKDGKEDKETKGKDVKEKESKDKVQKEKEKEKENEEEID